MVAIHFNQIHFSYGSKKVLENLSFEVKKGKITVLLGPNGAGKTTALQIILGTLSPESGEVKVLEGNPRKDSIKKQFGYVPQELSFPQQLTAQEVFYYVSHLHGIKRPQVELIERFGISPFANTKASQLSGGQKRRLGLAIAFCAEPKLLILDEPTTGLDLESRVWFWQLVNNYAQAGGTVVLTTHDIYEISSMNCEGLLINKGKTVDYGPMDLLLRKAKYKKISFQLNQEINISHLVDKIEVNDNWLRCWTRDPESVVKYLVENKIHFTDIQIERGSIEEILVTMGGVIT